MEDIKIKISKESRMVYLSKSRIGNEAENLQGNLVFSFKDEFVNGQARLELTIDGQDSWIPLLKEEETYYCPIKSAITKKGQIDMQLVITENEDEEGIPIFKSNVFYMHCDKSINAEIEQPDEYPTWIEIANEKLNEMDNLDIDATKVDDTTTVTITKKDGTEESVEIKDGNGVGLDYDWEGTSLGVKREDEQEYVYTDLKGPKGDPGAVKMQVVETLPATGAEDTIYLVPKTGSTGDIYDEYIYTNGSWEKIGSTDIDLSNYATKDEVNAKYTKPTTGIPSTDLASGVIPDISGKEDTTNKVTSISASSTDTQYPSAKCLYDAIQSAGGSSYLGLASSYTSSNRLDLNSLDEGVYYLLASTNGDDIYLKATVGGNELTGSVSLQTQQRLVANNVYVLTVKQKIEDMTFASASTLNLFGYISLDCRGSNNGILYDYYKTNRIRISQSAIDTSYGESSQVNLTPATTNSNQTISGKKTFSTIPELSSGLTPTTDNQLVNKKYVDDNAGGTPIYLGYIKDFTSSNRLDVTNLEPGTYIIRVPYQSFSGLMSTKKFYIKATINSVDFNYTYEFPLSPSRIMGDFMILNIESKVSSLTLTSEYTLFARLYYTYISTTSPYSAIKYNLSTFGINNSGLESSNSEIDFYLSLLDKDQTISGLKTFSTLPESSVTPTTNNQLTNKSYVDGKPTTYTGYDATKTQVLKNINGTLTWVDET